MTLHLSCRSIGARPLLPLRILQRLARRACKVTRLPKSGSLELSVAFVGRRQSAEANEGYRRHSGATDVLTFHLGTPQSSRHDISGEILLCPPVIRERAQRSGQPLSNETQMLFVHGILHLLGYHHDTQKDFQHMHRLEVRILGSAYVWDS